MPKTCRRDGCDETAHSSIGMEYHLLRDHDPLAVGGLAE